MKKITTPALAEFIAELTCLRPSVLRTITRRLREAGHLSQAGHGRGAAAATSRDAAVTLLVALAELPPEHSAVVAAQIAACQPGHKFIARHQIKGGGVTSPSEHSAAMLLKEETFMRGAKIPPNPFSLIAYLIENPRFVKGLKDPTLSLDRQQHIAVYLDIGRLGRLYMHGIGYSAVPLKPFREKFGKPAIQRTHRLNGSAILKISVFLGIEDEYGAEGPEVA